MEEQHDETSSDPPKELRDREWIVVGFDDRLSDCCSMPHCSFITMVVSSSSKLVVLASLLSWLLLMVVIVLDSWHCSLDDDVVVGDLELGVEGELSSNVVVAVVWPDVPPRLPFRLFGFWCELRWWWWLWFPWWFPPPFLCFFFFRDGVVALLPLPPLLVVFVFEIGSRHI